MEFETTILSDSAEDIAAAAEIVKKGGVVGMPTETVYGLAANALDPDAVADIFKAKGRPQDNPLIVHIAEYEELDRLVCDVPDTARKLAEHFWPGPLTMVLKKRDIIPMVTSGGLDTVGIRFPVHKTAREFIRACGAPIAAPSANLSGSPSPTSAKHVYDDMHGRIPAIIDGGECPVGVESTVVCFEGDAVKILRPGFVSGEDMKAAGFRVLYARGITEEIAAGEKVLSPGMKYKHYSPKANVTIVEGTDSGFMSFAEAHSGDGVYFMIFGREGDFPYNNMVYGNTPEEQARTLFGCLREADDIGAKQVYVRCPEKSGVGLAVYNRLLRAAAFETVTV